MFISPFLSAGGFHFDESTSTELRAQQQHQMLPMPFGGMDDIVHHCGTLLKGSSFESFHPGVENHMAGLFSGSFVGSLIRSGQQMDHLPEHFQSSQVILSSRSARSLRRILISPMTRTKKVGGTIYPAVASSIL